MEPINNIKPNPRFECDKNSNPSFFLYIAYILRIYLYIMYINIIEMRRRLSLQTTIIITIIIRTAIFRYLPENTIIFRGSFYDSHPRRVALWTHADPEYITCIKSHYKRHIFWHIFHESPIVFLWYIGCYIIHLLIIIFFENMYLYYNYICIGII